MQTRNGLKTLFLIVIVFILSCAIPLEAAAASNSRANFLKTSLRFEPNHGQAAPQFDFVSHGKDYTVQLSSTEAVIGLPPTVLVIVLVLPLAQPSQ